MLPAEESFNPNRSLKELFVSTKDPKRILEQLVFATGKAIKPEKTLIIFDEVQECPNALNSLKYFQEEVNEYHIVCAGSLLGIKLSHTSFPVGKVEYLEMYPMTFTEFLLADNQENLVQYMESITKIEKIPDIIFNQLNENITQNSDEALIIEQCHILSQQIKERKFICKICK